MQQMKQIKFIGIVLFLVFQGCTSEDKICTCIKNSDAVLKKYDELRGKNITDSDKKALVKLIETKKASCKEFEQMSGPEMMERKSTCTQ